jgi:hypothetical protein
VTKWKQGFLGHRSYPICSTKVTNQRYRNNQYLFVVFRASFNNMSGIIESWMLGCENLLIFLMITASIQMSIGSKRKMTR